MCEKIASDFASDDSTSVYMSTSIEFKLLNFVLSATIENHDDGSSELLIQPQSPDNSGTVTLVQLLDSINSLFRGLGGENAIQLSVDTVFSYMEKFLKNLKMDELKISMHKIFLHVIKPAQGEATLEYAFGLKVASSKDTEPKNFSFAELESVSFDIWNTKNQHIVSAMKLTDIAQQLCYADDLNMGMEHG